MFYQKSNRVQAPERGFLLPALLSRVSRGIDGSCFRRTASVDGGRKRQPVGIACCHKINAAEIKISAGGFEIVQVRSVVYVPFGF